MNISQYDNETVSNTNIKKTCKIDFYIVINDKLHMINYFHIYCKSCNYTVHYKNTFFLFYAFLHKCKIFYLQRFICIYKLIYRIYVIREYTSNEN